MALSSMMRWKRTVGAVCVAVGLTSAGGSWVLYQDARGLRETTLRAAGAPLDSCERAVRGLMPQASVERSPSSIPTLVISGGEVRDPRGVLGDLTGILALCPGWQLEQACLGLRCLSGVPAEIPSFKARMTLTPAS